jgi:hypothetical protein
MLMAFYSTLNDFPERRLLCLTPCRATTTCLIPTSSTCYIFLSPNRLPPTSPSTSFPAKMSPSSSRAENDRDDIITEGTTKDTMRSWERWLKFCEQVGFTYPLLVDFEVSDGYRLHVAFCQAMKEGAFSAGCFTDLKFGMFRAALDHMVPAF